MPPKLYNTMNLFSGICNMYLSIKPCTCMLTLILLTPKVNSLCHQYRARLACTPVQSDRLYTVSWPTFSFHLDFPKSDNGKFQNIGRIIPFKKFGMVRVKKLCVSSRRLSYYKTDNIKLIIKRSYLYKLIQRV